MKTRNQEMIDQLMDEGEYAPMYPFISKSNLNDFQKILISLMLNDIRMNGSITWKHETYASKMNASRKGVLKQFNILTKIGIIIPFESNKRGSTHNKFEVSFSAISDYEPSKDVTDVDKDVTMGNSNQLVKDVTEGTKDVTEGTKDVTEGTKDVTDGSQRCNRSGHIKKPKQINKENNKEKLKGPNFDDSFFDDIDIETKVHYKTKEKQEQPKRDISQDELEEFLANLDI